MRPSKIAPLLALVVAAGCGSDFDIFNELKDFRLLAVTADAPALAPGQTAQLSAVTFEPTGTATISYVWSWCPLTTGSDQGFRCAFQREELQALVDEQAGGRVVEIPDYRLGVDPTAEFTYEFPPEFLRGLCMGLQAQNIPAFVAVPKCDGAFSISIRLEIGSGDKSIVAVKDLDLVFDEGPLNVNPRLGGLLFSPADTPSAKAPVAADGSTTLARGQSYVFTLDTDEDSAETYTGPGDDGEPTQKREILVATWYAETDAYEVSRTAFREGVSEFSRLIENTIDIPTAPNFPGETYRIIILLRDDRGGLTSLERHVRLE